MVAIGENRKRAIEALRRVRALAEEHGTDEQKQRLDKIMGGSIPAPNRYPTEFATYQTEALALLFELLGQHIEESKPRPRGRPRTKNIGPRKDAA